MCNPLSNLSELVKPFSGTVEWVTDANALFDVFQGAHFPSLQFVDDILIDDLLGTAGIERVMRMLEGGSIDITFFRICRVQLIKSDQNADVFVIQFNKIELAVALVPIYVYFVHIWLPHIAYFNLFKYLMIHPLASSYVHFRNQ